MNILNLTERLDILAEAGVISNKAKSCSLHAFRELSIQLGKEDIELSEMLFTHLPAALTRIDSGEKVGGIAPELLEEVKNSPYAEIAARHIDVIQSKWKKKIPNEEKEYLLLHYSSVIQVNQGGDKGENCNRRSSR